jgi:hypothetical protein
MKIPMRILPFKARECSRQIHTFIRVKFCRERVMSGRGNCRGKHSKSREKNNGETASHDYPPEIAKDGRQSFDNSAGL